ncbi:uncharacterized protein LOC144691870 [Cetorhinus maximus]
MNWTRTLPMAALYSWWLQAVLQAAATGTSPKVVNGTVNGTVFLAMPSVVIAQQILTIEWKYLSRTTRRSIVQLMLDKGNQKPHWFSDYRQRTHIYPNGSLSIQNAMLNDSGIYSCTVTYQNGEELTQEVTVNVLGGVVIIGEWWNASADSKLTLVKANETNGKNAV